MSNALPGGATQARPCRPRPADCSSATTMVPSGSSSRSSSCVDSAIMRCRYVFPKVELSRGATRAGVRGEAMGRKQASGEQSEPPAACMSAATPS